MARIKFKAKVHTVYNMDDTEAYKYVTVPTLTTSHCDMHAFRTHKRYGGIANSTLFPSVLSRIRDDVTEAMWGRRQCSRIIKLDALPSNVTIDAKGFLATVTIDVA